MNNTSISPDKLTFYAPCPMPVRVAPIPFPPAPPDDTPKPVHRGTGCGMLVHYCNKSNHSMQKVFRVYCGRWNCEKCGPILKGKWTKHLLTKFSDYEGQIYQKTIPKEEWIAYSQILRRNKALYTKIERKDGFYNVFSTCKQNSDKALSVDEVKKNLSNAISSATFKHRAITTCRMWSMTVKKTEPAIWEKIQTLPTTMSDVKYRLLSLGLNKNIISENNDCITFMVPQEWMDNEEAKCNLCLLLCYSEPESGCEVE